MTRTSPAGRSSSALLKTPWVRLVVISAPAGWGKTCLLRDWRLADTASGTAWMSVDTGDNDPVRFWAHVITGVTSVSAGFDAALRVLTAPGAAGLDTALPMLVNELAALPVPLTLVFDDYHLVSNQEVLHSVACLRVSAWPWPPGPTPNCRWQGCGRGVSCSRSGLTIFVSPRMRRRHCSTGR
jgi:ATP/maltotriose-dependent transcriptional regulator MalT